MDPSRVQTPGYPTTPGTYDLCTQSERGETIHYTLRIPARYDHQAALPLVLCLHFGGQATNYYGRIFLELIPEPGLGRLDAFLLAPTTQRGSWTTPAGETVALTALADVERHLRVDVQRRVVMGYSLGGIGAWHFAARFRERFMAAIPIAGAPGQVELHRLCDLPLYVIHSREDHIIPIRDDEEAVARLRARGAPVRLAVLPSGDHFDYRLVIAELHRVAAWLEALWQSRTLSS